MNDDSTAAPNPSGLEVTDLFKSFESAGESVSILRHLNLKMKPGDATSIVGPSGCGKSTLLYLISGLDRPDAGQIVLNGQNLVSVSEREQARIRNAQIGFIFQDHHLLPQLSLLENVLLPFLAGSGITQDRTTEAKELLERVGLKDRMTHRPAQISGGERQRAAVCRALLHRPALVLADEPTGNLDPSTAEVVGELLLEMSRDFGAMLLCVTHSLELAGRFPMQLELKDGELVDASQASATT